MVEKHPFMVEFAEFDFTYIHKSDGGYKKDFLGGKMKDFIQQVRILVYYTQSFAKLVSSIIQDLRLDIGSFVTFCWGTL